MQCMATASQGAGVVVQRGIEYDVEVDFSASEGTTANLLCIFSFSFSFSILLFFGGGGDITAALSRLYATFEMHADFGGSVAPRQT